MAKQKESDSIAEAAAEAPLDPVSAALARLAEIQAQTLAFQQQSLSEDRRVRPRENTNHPEISAYSYPEGNLKRKKPSLTRVTYCNKVKQNEDLLTPEEIEAFNAFTVNTSARDGQWTVAIEKNGTTERLLIDFPCKTPDDRMNLPNGLLLILKELREGPESVDVGSMAARLARLEAQLAASPAA